MSDLRAAVEGLANPWDEGSEFVTEFSNAFGFEKGRAAVLALIPEGAVLVTEETLAAALHDRDETVAVSVGDDSLRCDHPRECYEKAAAILRHLREGTK